MTYSSLTVLLLRLWASGKKQDTVWMYTSPRQWAAPFGSYQVSISLQERKVFSPACFLAKTLFVAWHPSRCTNRRASLPLRFANTTYQVVIGHILQQNVSLSSGMTGIQLPGLPQLQQFWEWGTEMRQFICKTESCIASNELKNKQKTTQMWHLLFSNYSCCIFTADEKQTSFSVLSLPACLETQLSLDACRSIFFKRSAFPF